MPLVSPGVGSRPSPCVAEFVGLAAVAGLTNDPAGMTVSPIARTVAAARPESLPMAPGDRLRWVLNKDSAATRRGWSQGPTNTLTATPSFSIDRPIEVSNQQRTYCSASYRRRDASRGGQRSHRTRDRCTPTTPRGRMSSGPGESSRPGCPGRYRRFVSDESARRPSTKAG